MSEGQGFPAILPARHRPESATGPGGEATASPQGAPGTTVKFGQKRADTHEVQWAPEKVELDPELELLIETSRASARQQLTRADLRAASALGFTFLAAAVPMALLIPSDRSPSVLLVAVLVLAYALVSRVKFEVGAGWAAPTQLVLVPMLFTLPAGTVPLAVAAALLAGNVVDRVCGDRDTRRLVLFLGRTWPAIGPAFVLALAGEPEPDWLVWPVFLVALAAQFALQVAIAAVEGQVSGGASLSSQRRSLQWVLLVELALAPVGLVTAAATLSFPGGVLLVLPLVGILAIFAGERRARIDHTLELSRAYRGTALLLGDVVEADDAYTGSHSRDVVALVLDVADELGFKPRERRHAELTALLHDVGKIRMPGDIINKPGPLSGDEWAVIETHTLEGERLLDQVGGVLAEVGHMVRSCHERWDGNGYPDGLGAEEIPLVARIVACCDAFSAMTTTRSYRAALPPETASAELRAHAGSQFDPRVVEALVRVVKRRTAPEREALPAAKGFRLAPELVRPAR